MLVVVIFVYVWGNAQLCDREFVRVHNCFEIGLEVGECLAVLAPVLLLKHIKYNVIKGGIHFVPYLNFIVLMRDHNSYTLVCWLSIGVLNSDDEC